MTKKTEKPPTEIEESSLWDFTFSSEFEVGDDCAKFTPCYSQRPHHEPIDTEASLLNTVAHCSGDQKETSEAK